MTPIANKMMNLQLLTIMVLAVATMSINADLLGCDEISMVDVPIIGPQVASDEQKVRSVFKDFGCSIQRGVKKMGTKMANLGTKVSAKMKDIGANINTRFSNLREKITKGSTHADIEDNPKQYVEIIDPDILKIEQICGHGHVLDALGNCSKLRK